MNTLYLECRMGAAGDMLMAALLELIPDRDAFLERMNTLGLPGVRVTAEPSVKCGITGTHVRVTVNGEDEITEDVPGQDHSHGHGQDHSHEHDHEPEHAHPHDHAHGHSHATLNDIRTLIGGLPVSPAVRDNAMRVYSLIADAESRVHGRPVEDVHFHEVGTMDAVADVVGVCLLMEKIGADRILASPVHVGSGHVRCMHGILPVPAPATALLLEGIPTYGGAVEGELCTPTGAALLRVFARSFGDQPVMAVRQIGCGMGTKDFPRANCLRSFLGETWEPLQQITCLECSLDDMTAEDLSFAMEKLFEAGALDVFTQAIGMKKNRPGVLLTCVCVPDLADPLARLMLRHTTTLGVRRRDCSRYALRRENVTRTTSFGPVRWKHAWGFGIEKSKPEYEDIAAIAREKDLPLSHIRSILEKESGQDL